MGNSFSEEEFEKVADLEAMIDGNVYDLNQILNDPERKRNLELQMKKKNFQGRTLLHSVLKLFFPNLE